MDDKAGHNFVFGGVGEFVGLGGGSSNGIEGLGEGDGRGLGLIGHEVFEGIFEKR